MTFAYWRKYRNCLAQEWKPSGKLQEHVNPPRVYRPEWKPSDKLQEHAIPVRHCRSKWMPSVRNIQPQLEAIDLQALYSQDCESKLKIEGSGI